MKGVAVFFVKDKVKYAFRRMPESPQVGDYLWLKDTKTHQVTERAWALDRADNRMELHCVIKEVEEA